MSLRPRQLFILFSSLCTIAFFGFIAGCGNSAGTQVASNSGTGSGSGNPSGSPSGAGSGSGPSSGGGSGPSTTGNGAYVFVSNPTTNAIYEFAAAANGTMTPVPGSPYKISSPGALTANSSYLFALEPTNNIVSYSIGTGGALTKASSITDSNGPGTAFMDAIGQTVYTEIFGVANYTYDAFALQQNGALTAKGSASGGPLVTDPRLSFTSNNAFAYGAGCYKGSPSEYAYTRAATGTLTYFNPDATLPQPPNGDGYCPVGTAVSGNGSLVMPLELVTNDGLTDAGSGQLAIFTIGANGTLTTSSTAATMPTPQVGSINYVPEFDPTGTYLAVGGSTGLAIYSFSNGTLTLTGTEQVPNGVQQLAWDTSGNLYAIDWTTGNVYGYHVVKGVPTEVSGSPYVTAASSNSTPGFAVAPIPAS